MLVFLNQWVSEHLLSYYSAIVDHYTTFAKLQWIFKLCTYIFYELIKILTFGATKCNQWMSNERINLKYERRTLMHDAKDQNCIV